jgi:molybdopterin-guanine dinucleotide biosynthesis protein A
MRVTGFAVAGGQSRRMGQDKALLAWGGGDLLEHALLRLRVVTPDVRILSGPESRYGLRGAPEVLDGTRDAGSLAGLLAGLAVIAGPGLFLGVDLPFVPSALLAHLTAIAEEEGADVVVPVSPRGPEPLAAFYGPACLEPVQRSVAEGRFKMTAFWPEVRVREVSPAELVAFGDPAQLFANVNTREDYAAARAGESAFNGRPAGDARRPAR